MLTNFLIPNLKIHRMARWCPPHLCKTVKKIISDTFGAKVISKGFPSEWPANSPDLNPLDYLIWSHLKTKIFSDNVKPKDFEELKRRITAVIAKTTRTQLDSSIKNVVKCLKACMQNGGGHFE